MKKFHFTYGLLAVFLLFAVTACGNKTKTVFIEPGHDPATLFYLDSDRPLDESQQKTRLHAARTLLPRVEDGKFIMSRTWEETEKENVARPYYDYMVELLGIYNDFLDRNENLRQMAISTSTTDSESICGFVSSQYLHFGDDYSVVNEFTHDLAMKIGLTEAEFTTFDEQLRQSETMVNEFIKQNREFIEQNPESGASLEDLKDIFLRKKHLFFSDQYCDETGCTFLYDNQLKEEFDKLQEKYSKSGDYPYE